MEQKNEQPTKGELVRFVFPEAYELSLYALGTLQAFVAQYQSAYERKRMLDASGDSPKELSVAVHCQQKFYLEYQESFPACSQYIPPWAKPEIDEMCVILHEKVLGRFNMQAAYSMQWAMGQIAGTKPRIVPQINGHARNPIGPLIFHQYLSFLKVDPDGLLVVTPPMSTDMLTMRRLLSHATVIVAPQSPLTVLGVALGIPTLEITEQASQRAFLAQPGYGQVSKLTGADPRYFEKSVERGLAWLTKTTSPSPALSVETPSLQSALQP